MTIDDLVSALRGIASDDWQASQQPVLLSRLPKKLAERLQGDYKLIPGFGSLKNFIKESSPDSGFRLVEHPTQRAKLGIVPTGIDFEFPIESDALPLVGLSKQDVEGFTRVLRSLTPDELRRVALPANLVVRLLDTK